MAQDAPTYVEQFHNVINQDVNFKRRSQDEQLRAAMTFLDATDPEFRSIPFQTPQGRALKERVASGFLADALQPTFGEELQQKVEDWGPPLVGAAAAVATKRIPPQVLPFLGGRFGSPAVASGVGGAVGQVGFEQARPLTTTLPPIPPSESMGRGLENLFIYPALDLPMQAMFKGLGTLRRELLAPGATSEVTWEARAGLEPLGGTLGLSQLSGEKTPLLPGLAEGLGEAGVGGRFFTAPRKAEVEAAVGKLAEQVEAGLLPQLQSLTKVGQQTLKSYDFAHEAAQAVGSGYFKVVDDLSRGGVTVPMSSTLRYMTEGPSSKEITRQFEIREIIQEGKAPIPGYAGPTALFDIADSAGPQWTTFADAQRIRSELLRIARDNEGATDAVQRQAGRQASLMAKELLKSMDTTAKHFDPSGQAAAAYQHARDFWRDEVAEKFENDLMTRLVKKVELNPSTVASLLANKTQFDTAQALKKALPARWEVVRRHMIHDMIEDSVKPTASALGMTGRRTVVGSQPAELDGGKLLRNFSKLGRDYQALVLDGTPNQDVRRFAMALEAAERTPPQFGTVAVLLGQAAAVGALAATPFGGVEATPANVMVLAGPSALGYLLSRRQLLRNIADGILGGQTEIVARTIAFANAQAVAEEARDQMASLRSMGSPITDLLPAGPRLEQGGQAAQAAPRPPVEPPSISTLPDLPARLLKPRPPFFLSAE